MQDHPPIDARKHKREALVQSHHSSPRPYHRPKLTCFGDVRDLTLGASGNNPESGGNFIPSP